MAEADFQNFVDEVIDKNDIADVISEYAKLKRVGSRFAALCPLHNDKKSPSLSISPDKQLFHCFGCGAGGNVIHFIMAAEHLDFMDALRYLADRAHIPMPEFSHTSGGRKENQDKKQLIYKLNADAARYFYSCLASEKGKDALAYLKKREIKNSTIRSFGMGYAPEGWDNLLNYLKTKGYKEAGSNEDTKKPVIKLKGNSTITIKENEEFKDPGATATDDVDGDITKNIKTKGTVDTKKPGKYTITYTVSDKAGNKATKKREVVVVKSETTTSTSTTTTVSTTTTTPTKKTNARTTRRVTTRVNTTKAPVTTTKVTAKPTITLKGERTVTINKGSVYTDPGYTAKDALGNNITSRVTVNSNLNTNVKGTYTIKYSVVDGYGNVSNTAIRYVIVKDTVSSVSVSISPNSMSLSVGESKRLTAYLSPSSSSATITWTSTDPSVAIVSNGLVTAKKKGSTTITASVGNSKSTSLITVK